jgi:hypothetical protein
MDWRVSGLQADVHKKHIQRFSKRPTSRHKTASRTCFMAGEER